MAEWGSSESIDCWEDFLVKSKIEFQDRYNSQNVSDMTITNFEIIKTIGKGTFGTVVMAKNITTHEYHAIKIIKKSLIVEANHVSQSSVERRILQSIKFKFIISMDYYFSDCSYIYFVMPLIHGGDMFSALSKFGRFDEEKSAFYAAQVVLAFEYLHYLEVIYRDLKPENVLIDITGYLKLTDLGFAKIVHKRTYTLCGTPDYLAPEILLSNGYSFSADWWALGIFIFEMCTGQTPFHSEENSKTYELIISRSYTCPPDFSESLVDIMNNLLQFEVSRRLGCLRDGAADIKSHKWFKDVVWLDILNRKVKAPYIPTSDMDDTSNFDEYENWTWEGDEDTIYDEEFENF